MATIEKRIGTNGEVSFRVKVRMHGFPSESATFPRLHDAKKWSQNVESAQREGRYFPAAKAHKRLMSELFDRYAESVIPRTPKSQQKKSLQLGWWKQQIGSYAVGDVTASLIAECRDNLLKQKTFYKQQYSPATVNRYLALLSHVYTTAMKEWEWAQMNPVSRITKCKESRGRTRYLSDDELQGLLKACKESKASYLYIAVRLALLTGARKMEVLGLKWKQVDSKHGVIHLTETKTDEPRTVPLVPQVVDILKEWRDSRKVRNIKDTGMLVFPGTNKAKPVYLRAAWESALKRACIEDFKFHDLRHSAASFMIQAGVDVAVIGKILGHKHLATTMRYAHLSPGTTGNAAEKLAEKILSA